MAPDAGEMDAAAFRAAWDQGQRLADEAYGAIRPVARKLRRAMRWEQFVQYDFIESRGAEAVSWQTYLVTKTLTTPEADYPNLKRWDVVTPGYTWHLRRHHPEQERDELAVSLQIVLTVDWSGEAKLRSGDLLKPATPEAWAELSARVLEPRKVRLKRLFSAPGRALVTNAKPLSLVFVPLLVLIAIITAFALGH